MSQKDLKAKWRLPEEDEILPQDCRTSSCLSASNLTACPVNFSLAILYNHISLFFEMNFIHTHARTHRHAPPTGSVSLENLTNAVWQMPQQRYELKKGMTCGVTEGSPEVVPLVESWSCGTREGREGGRDHSVIQVEEFRGLRELQVFRQVSSISPQQELQVQTQDD